MLLYAGLSQPSPPKRNLPTCYPSKPVSASHTHADTACGNLILCKAPGLGGAVCGLCFSRWLGDFGGGDNGVQLNCAQIIYFYPKTNCLCSQPRRVRVRESQNPRVKVRRGRRRGKKPHFTKTLSVTNTIIRSCFLFFCFFFPPFFFFTPHHLENAAFPPFECCLCLPGYIMLSQAKQLDFRQRRS